MRLIAVACVGLMSATPAMAQERETLGFGRVFTNDYFGDYNDRWRTASYSYSIVRGHGWHDRTPTTPGALLEYRLRSEIIAPSRLNGEGSDDRAYAGTLSVGLHTHFNRGGVDVAAGLDIVATGPQTGLADAQDWFHGTIGTPSIADAVKANQVANAVYPTLVIEASYPIAVGGPATVRPFIEGQYGVEDFVRFGADILIGASLQNDLWLRDNTSGQLYSGIESGETGVGFVFGADYTMVSESAYFPSSFGTQAEDERFRARAGVHWRLGPGMSCFYGLTYLSEEFIGQPEGQFVGSIKLNFNF